MGAKLGYVMWAGNWIYAVEVLTPETGQPASDGGNQSCFQQDNSEEFSI